jgi:cysteine desulfurase
MRIIPKRKIYLDYASATPIDRDVLKLIHSSDRRIFANPNALYKDAVFARQKIEGARSKIAQLINAHSDEIIFTSSGTESVAIAILGTVYACKPSDLIPNIVTTSIEHPAVLENCKLLESKGLASVTYVPCDSFGFVNPKDIKEALKDNTVLVSVMYANNEIGTIQNIREIAKEVRHFKKNKNSTYFPLIHTDACQAMNYLDVSNIEKLGVDLMSFNGSKIYGTKGSGVLYKKRIVKLDPIYEGGGQEFGLRSGTENTIVIEALALALDKTFKIKDEECSRLTNIRDYCIERLLNIGSSFEITLNGSKENRLPNNVNISINGISSELMVIELDALGICVSERSACGSSKEEGSHVIKALHMGNIENKILNTDSLRISLGRNTKKKEIDVLVRSIEKILSKYKDWK